MCTTERGLVDRNRSDKRRERAIAMKMRRRAPQIKLLYVMKTEIIHVWRHLYKQHPSKLYREASASQVSMQPISQFICQETRPVGFLCAFLAEPSHPFLSPYYLVVFPFPCSSLRFLCPARIHKPCPGLAILYPSLRARLFTRRGVVQKNHD